MIHHDDSQEILAQNSTTLEELQELNQESARQSARRAAAKAAQAVPAVVAPKPEPRKLDALQAISAGGSLVIELAPPKIENVFQVVHRVLDDGGFDVRAAERKAMLAALAEDAELLRLIMENGEGTLRQKRKEELPHATAPMKHIDLIVAEARIFIRTLKERRRALRKRMAPLAAAMLERALIAADTVTAIVEENERSRAEDFSVEWEPSCVLKAFAVARRMIAEHGHIARKAGDLVDIHGTCRLLDIRPEPAKSGTKLLNAPIEV